MSEEETPWLQFVDGIEGGIPEFQLNVGRRRGRKNERVSFNADAGGIANKRDAFRRLKVGHVMGGVTGSIEHKQLLRAKRKSFTPLERVEIMFGHRQKVAEQTLHIVTVQALGAGQQAGRVSHVNCSPSVNKNLQMRILLEKRAGGAGVVEVNVREENRLEVADGAIVEGELFTKIPKRGGWAWIDKSAEIPGAQECGRDGTRTALPVQIQGGNEIHSGKTV